VLLMPARLAGEIRRRPGRSSLLRVSGLAERAQEPAETLRTDKEGFELHRPPHFVRWMSMSMLRFSSSRQGRQVERGLCSLFPSASAGDWRAPGSKGGTTSGRHFAADDKIPP
jgi:hypothetical protein